MLLMTGMTFTAKDKLGRTYIYKFIGIETNENTGCAYIHLHNETLNVSTNVEYAWFRERTIQTC